MRRGSCAAKHVRTPISKGPKEPLFPPILYGYNLGTGGRGSWRGGQVKPPQHPLPSGSLRLPRLGGGAQAPARAPLLSRAQQLTDGSLISPSLIFPRLSIPCPGKPVFSGPIRLENFRNVVGKAAPHCSAGAIQLCPFEQISFFFLLKKKKLQPWGVFTSDPSFLFLPLPDLFSFPAGKSCQTTASHPQHSLLPCSSPPAPAPLLLFCCRRRPAEQTVRSMLPTLPLERPPRAAGNPFPFLGP